MAHLHEIVFASSDKIQSRRISRQLGKGMLRQLAPRVYTTNLEDTPEKIILRNWYIILSHLFPKAVISHRSAAEGRPVNGHIFLTYSYTRNVELPGLTVHLLKGPGHDTGATHFFEVLYRSTEPRMFLENLQSARSTSGISKIMSREDLEDRLEVVIRIRGEQALIQIREDARSLAPAIEMEKESTKLDKLIGALLSTYTPAILNSEVARARSQGEPFDPARTELLRTLYDYLADKVFREHTDLNISEKAYHNFAFFESYFSNFIEGIEFEIEEAKAIIRTDTPLSGRDEDSHDILGTYHLVSDKKEMSLLPQSADHLLQLLRTRHAVLLKARTSKNPGQFKDQNNRAGSTAFVDWKLVAGTLKKGYEWYSLLKEPFARASYMMFMITEIHPFLDGNGRIARIMMNAELTAKGMSKIIIPTVYRIDYLGALRKLTRKAEPEAYINMLTRAYAFSATVHAEDLEEMEAYLKGCNAFESDDAYILKF